ncbi:MAG: hypothetical protein NT169_21400 [Chloroflexi bacterium]|nr:hypothetical protein [Chloroflexota bacterium]
MVDPIKAESHLGRVLPGLLANLVVGLLGVPVAFTIQEIAKKTLSTEGLFLSRSWPLIVLGIEIPGEVVFAGAVAWLVIMLILYSVLLVVYFQVPDVFSQSDAKASQLYVVVMIVFQVLLAIAVVAVVIAVGIIFPESVVRSGHPDMVGLRDVQGLIWVAVALVFLTILPSGVLTKGRALLVVTGLGEGESKSVAWLLGYLCLIGTTVGVVLIS